MPSRTSTRLAVNASIPSTGRGSGSVSSRRARPPGPPGPGCLAPGRVAAGEPKEARAAMTGPLGQDSATRALNGSDFVVGIADRYFEDYTPGAVYEYVYAGVSDPGIVESWKKQYARDWRYFATDDTFEYLGHTVQGLNLPRPVLKKLYHDNAVRWIPGVVGNSN